MTSRACATCRYFEAYTNDPTIGACHRYPPKDRQFEVVMRFEWCGEYLPKKGK